MSKYEEQGAKAFRGGHTRESCRYKAADIVREWLAGWDAAIEQRTEAKRKAAIPRWEGHGGDPWTGKPSTSWHLCGEAPKIYIHHERYIGDPDAWFASVHEWGIERVDLGTTDHELAKRHAITRVREVMEERLTALVNLARTDGTLRSEEQP